MGKTMFFFPVAILVSSQILGVRTAFAWLVISVVAIGLFYVVTYGFNDTLLTSRFDELALQLGVAVCVFFCCQQGEEFFRERMQDLIDLSRDLRQKGKELHKLATTDSLTGLMNRFQFQQTLKNRVDHSHGTPQPFALLMIDMDGFKEINDTLGHQVGDAALVEIATRLRNKFEKTPAQVARLGGDEFCIILPNSQDDEQASSTAKEISEILTQRYICDEADFPLGASIGYALYPQHAKTERELLAFADTAMFHAKENRLGHASYQTEMTDRLVEYRSTQEKLSRALERDEFFVVYQPQVDILTGKVFGVEALMRWRHKGEIISPFRFIPLLEQSHEIIPVSNWLVRQVCQQQAAWFEAGYQVKISINVSAVQFNDPDFCDNTISSISEFGLDATTLDFEITEGLLVEDIPLAVEKLDRLKALGSTVSIDDFGTGYSSLAYLRQFPIDRLKIDRAFIKDIPLGDDGAIAIAIIALAKTLGLQVLAEGVETEDHLEFIRAYDCDEYQGYLLSPPVSADEVVAYFPTSVESLAIS